MEKIRKLFRTKPPDSVDSPKEGRTKRKRPRRPRRHPIRNLPLKWSFMLYVLLCALVAIVLSVTVGAWFSSLQSDLYAHYEAQYLQTHKISYDAYTADTLEDFNEEEFLLLYRMSENLNMTPRDEELYDFYGAMSLLCVPLVCMLCILVAGFAFYNRKLRRPLQLIDSASAQIASGNLDFVLEYPNRNEMGRLANSFETMRASLQENHREMWRMIEQRKRLNAAFAHDLRTPLTVLRGYTEYLSTYVPQKRVSEEKLLDTVSMMHAYVQRLEGYTGSMSAMQKLEEVMPTPQTIAFDVLCQRLQSAADMLGGTCRVHFTCEGEDFLTVDPDIITQVLENLVANAKRYAKGEIRVRVTRDGDGVRVAVSDDGPGFPEAILQKGLAPYNHSRGEDIHSEHFGLGLYICSVLCQRHGGTLFLPPAAGLSEVTATFEALEKETPSCQIAT